MPDKNKAMITFLMDCPIIKDNNLFFNFADKSHGNNNIISEQDTTKRTYVDGSVLKHYTFSIVSYSSVTYNALVEDNDFSDTNVEYMANVQSILDWINEQADNHNFPDFGPDCEIEEMLTLSTDPDINGIDTSVTPPVAVYSIGVKLSYLDKSKVVWN